jgi:hypothetical protein
MGRKKHWLNKARGFFESKPGRLAACPPDISAAPSPAPGPGEPTVPHSVVSSGIIPELAAECTTERAPEVTADVTTEVTSDMEGEVMEGRFVVKRWCDPKELPRHQLYNGDTVRVWATALPPPRRQPTAEEHAGELLACLQRQPLVVGRWIISMDLEFVIYPRFCADIGWMPRPWLGRKGVASHLKRLTKARYRRVEIGGTLHNLMAYFIPLQQPATDSRSAKRRQHSG